MYLIHFTNTEGIQLELAKPKDAKVIGVMSRDLIEYGLGWSWTPARVYRHIQSANSMVLVARAEQTVRGFAILQMMGKHANLSLLAVDPSFQGQGIGRDLVKFVEQAIATAGIATIFLELREINEEALTFYQSLGYREIGRIPHYYRGRETAIRMVHQQNVSTILDNSTHNSTS